MRCEIEAWLFTYFFILLLILCLYKWYFRFLRQFYKLSLIPSRLLGWVTNGHYILFITSRRSFIGLPKLYYLFLSQLLLFLELIDFLFKEFHSELQLLFLLSKAVILWFNVEYSFIEDLSNLCKFIIFWRKKTILKNTVFPVFTFLNWRKFLDRIRWEVAFYISIFRWLIRIQRVKIKNYIWF